MLRLNIHKIRRLLIIPIVLLVACGEVNDESVSAADSMEALEVKKGATLEAVTHEDELFFVHDSLGDFFLCTSIVD